MHYTFNIYRNGKKINTCFASYSDAEDMRASLISHDGYDSTITVRRVWRNEFIVQGHCDTYGWEDLCSEATRKEAMVRFREYRENEGDMPTWRHRLIRRKVQA
jgi:hypothetical protein